MLWMGSWQGSSVWVVRAGKVLLFGWVPAWVPLYGLDDSDGFLAGFLCIGCTIRMGSWLWVMRCGYVLL